MKFGDLASLSPTGVDKKGRGTGLLENGKPFAVAFVGPGETAEASFNHRDSGVRFFKMNEITKPSLRRVTPRCKFVGRCGGCSWQQFDYGWQLELKRDLINQALTREGFSEQIDSVLPCPDLYYYRNRMDYCVGPNGELGLKELGNWRNHLDLTECFLLSPETPALMDAFRGWMKDNQVEPWDNRRYTGYARYLVIREGKHTGKRTIMIVTSAGVLPASDDLLSRLKPLATTIYHSVNNEITDLSIGQELHLLYGEALLEEEVCGKRFQIHPNAFFQTNTVMAEQLVLKVKDFLSDRPVETLLDLYCGVGLLGICLADTAKQVIGVELIPEAIEMATKNAARNGVGNAKFVAAAAESLLWEQEKPDTVIVDPPRAGLHPKVIKTLLEKAPERLVYVSCNYESFVRDFKMLGEKYQITKLAALDLFPHTAHVELVTLLTKK